LSGDFDNTTVARIIVGNNGKYVLHTGWDKSKSPPIAQYTCIFLKEFTGLPPSSGFGSYEPSPVTSTMPSLIGNQISYGNRDVCIWAGVAGALSVNPGGRNPNVSFARDEGGTAFYTWYGGEAATDNPITTYVQCGRFPGSGHGFVTWRHSPRKNLPLYLDPFHDTGGSRDYLPVRPNQYWCYLEGVASIARGLIEVELGIDKTPPPPYDAGGAIYYERTILDSGMYRGCLSLDQSFHP
jgi:hypothetical protein